MKTCGMCGQPKDLSDFHRNKTTKDGRTSRCKECAKATTREWYSKNTEKAKASAIKARKSNPDAYWRRYYKRQYGITLERYQELLLVQGGVCAICGRECGSRGRLAVDHDHKCCPGNTSCGKCVRGLLCARCNQGIGHMEDDAARLRRAADYLS